MARSNVRNWQPPIMTFVPAIGRRYDVIGTWIRDQGCCRRLVFVSAVACLTLSLFFFVILAG